MNVHPLRTDALLAAAIAVVILIVTPGLVVAAMVALVALALLAVTAGAERRRAQDAIAEAIDPLIDAGLDDDHRRLLAYGIVGMAEGVSRRFMAQRPGSEAEVDEEAQKLAGRMADLAWAGLRSVHPD